MAVELASGYVTLTTSAQGLRREITREFDDVGRTAATAGDEGGRQFGRKFGGALAGLGAGLGLAIGGALVKGTLDAIDQGAAADRLVASLGIDDPAAAERIGRVQGEIYARAYGDSLDDVGAAIQAINTNIGDIGDIDDASLQDLAATAFDVSQVLGEDVGRSVRGVGQLLRTGLVDDAETGFDLVVASAQRLPQEMRGELIDTIEEYSSSFAELGLTGPQALASISAAVEAGARNTDVAADALKEFSIRAIDGSDTTAAAYEALGFSAEEMAQQIAQGGPAAAEATSQIIQALSGVTDQVDQEAIGVALFGTKFEDLGADVIAAMDPAANSLGLFEGEAARVGETLNDNLSTRVEALKRQGFQALARIAEATVIPMLESLFELVGPLGPVFDDLVGRLTGFFDVLRTGVVDGESTPLTELALQIREDVLPLLPEITKGIAEIVNKAAPILGKLFTIVVETLDLIATIWREWGDEITFVVTSTLDVVVPIVSAALDIIAGIIRTVTAIIEGDWSGAWDGIKQVVRGALDLIAGILRAALGQQIRIGREALSRLWAFFADGWAGAVETVRGWRDDVLGFIRGMPAGIRRAASGMWDGILDRFRDMVDGIRNLWNRTVGGFSISIPGWVPGYGGNSFSVPRLHDGGTVPGAPGTEHLYLLEAGETVISADDSRRMAEATGPDQRGSGQMFGDIHVHNRPVLEELREAYALLPAP